MPNVLMIVADDLGYGDLGCFGNEISQTPALDALADEGVCLTQHYAASPVCAPARASLLTGRYPHRTGVIDTREARGLDRLALRESTIADKLSRVGYATGLIGKWHLGSLDRRYSPNERGFDEFVGFHGAGIDYWDYRLYYNDRIVRSSGVYATELFTTEAVGFIERHAHEPFFLEVAYNAPHLPWQAPDASVRPFLRDDGKADAVSTIYGMISCMDTGIARILDALRSCRIEENTIVLFVSDNGPDMSGSPDFSGDSDDALVRFNGGFKGSKGMVFEGGIRVPGIVRWPAGLTPGQKVDGVVHFVDWLPTLLAFTGHASDVGDPALDGANLAPMLRGEVRDQERRLWWQWNRYAPVKECNAAMRDGKWKLVRPRIPEAMQVDFRDSAMDRSLRGDGPLVDSVMHAPLPAREIPPPPPPLLFDLAADPYEVTDVADQNPDRVLAMGRELDAWFYEVESERGTIAN